MRDRGHKRTVLQKSGIMGGVYANSRLPVPYAPHGERFGAVLRQCVQRLRLRPLLLDRCGQRQQRVLA